MITDNGLNLAYMDNPQGKIKGSIPINEIEKIEQHKKEFTLIIPGRDFHLRADSEDLAAKWVDTL